MYLNETLPSIYEAVLHWRAHAGLNLSPADRSVINWLVKIGAM